MLDLGECLLLDADNLPSAVHLLAVQTPQPSNNVFFLLESEKFRFFAVHINKIK